MVNVECFPSEMKNKVRMSTDIISCQVCEEGSSAIRKENKNYKFPVLTNFLLMGRAVLPPCNLDRGQTMVGIMAIMVSILKEISPEYSLEGLMMKLKLQYFDHLMQRTNSLERTLILGKIESKEEKWTTGNKMVG